MFYMCYCITVSSQGEKGRRGRGKACQRGPPGIPGLTGLDVIRNLHTNNCILHSVRTLSIHKHVQSKVMYIFYAGGGGKLGYERRQRGARTQCMLTMPSFYDIFIIMDYRYCFCVIRNF